MMTLSENELLKHETYENMICSYYDDGMPIKKSKTRIFEIQMMLMILI